MTSAIHSMFIGVPCLVRGAVGFALAAKNPGLWGAGYYRADIFSMIFLRSAMMDAGMKEELIYGKFLANDGFLVTPLQARTIAEKLNAWLEGKILRLDLAEENKAARKVNDVIVGVFQRMDGK